MPLFASTHLMAIRAVIYTHVRARTRGVITDAATVKSQLEGRHPGSRRACASHTLHADGGGQNSSVVGSQIGHSSIESSAIRTRTEHLRNLRIGGKYADKAMSSRS